MTDAIRGILSHRRLMELKNCGVIYPEFFEKEAEQMFRFYMLTITAGLENENPGLFSRLFYGNRQASLDTKLMFPEREDLLEHLICLDGVTKYLVLSRSQLDEFILLHQAAVSTRDAKKVLACFKFSDQVIVDESTGRNIDWLLKNAYILKQRVSAKTED